MDGKRNPDTQALSAASRVLDGAARVGESFETAQIFPAEAYTGEDFWRFERWAIFEHEWLCVGHVNQVATPGDYFGITLIDEPLIVSRTDAGDIVVVSGICQHRGHPLLDGLAATEPQGTCRHGRLLVCPYHSWSYTLDGALHAAPGMSRTAPLADLRKRQRLPRIRHEIIQGLIFINFDWAAAPLEPSLQSMLAMIEGYGLADLIPNGSTVTPIRSNWKLYQENSLEPYHTDTVHRSSHNPAPARLSAFYAFNTTDGAIITTTGFASSSELFAAGSGPSLPQIPKLSDEQQGRLLFIAVLPVLFLLFEPGSVLVTLALPTGAESMTLQTFSLYPKSATTLSHFDSAVQAQAAALQVIVREDVKTQEALQRGHASRFTPAGTLSWLEATLPQMNSWLATRYRAALNKATAIPSPKSGTSS
jgi:phenylpropionate dioxygenase-like ring-hydroxylating dioxygenase large terminal subunit